MCGKLPHVETLSSPDNYSFLPVKCACINAAKVCMYKCCLLQLYYMVNKLKMVTANFPGY